MAFEGALTMATPRIEAFDLRPPEWDWPAFPLRVALFAGMINSVHAMQYAIHDIFISYTFPIPRRHWWHRFLMWLGW